MKIDYIGFLSACGYYNGHTAKTTMETLQKLKWNLLTHPPYSPDLAPGDFYLFGRLKSDLQGMRFADCSGVDRPPTTSLF